MKSPSRVLFCGALLAAAWSSPAAGGEGPDPAEMLKVPPAEARPTGAEPDTKAAATPAPEQSPPEATPQDPAGAGSAPESGEAVGLLPAFPLSRYETLWERSPFQLESVAPPVESAGLSQRYALTGLAAINGEPIAFLMERATQNRLMVKKDSEANGLSLVQVDVQQKYTDSSATVRQGSEIGVLRFDATAAAPMMPPAGMAQPPRMVPPGVPPPGAVPQQTARVPGIPTPPQIPGQAVPGQGVPGAPQVPGVVPPVPGPGVPSNGQVQGEQQQMPPPRVIRRRALIPAAP